MWEVLCVAGLLTPIPAWYLVSVVKGTPPHYWRLTGLILAQPFFPHVVSTHRLPGWWPQDKV